MKKIFDKLPVVLCYLIAIAFSIKSFREPDLWWQIRTGEWILEHHQIPTSDIFSFTFAGVEWVNIKWGFEIIAALISRWAGPEFVFMIQALVCCLMIFFLIRFSKILSPFQTDLGRFIPFGLLATFVAVEYRIIGRPEMFSHLFTVVFLFLLIQYRKEKTNSIFWLIPLQLIWSNMHEAFAIGIVLSSIFAAAAWFEFYLSKHNSWFAKSAMPIKISGVLIAQIASVVINPHGYKLLARPLNILGQVYENKYTTELLDFTNPAYWQWNAYLTIGILLIGIAGNFIHFGSLKTKQSRFRLFIQQFGFGYLIVLITFLYLSLTAYRNIVFLLLGFFPLLCSGFEGIWRRFFPAERLFKYWNTAFLILGISLYVSVVTNKFYEVTGSHDRFGMEVLSTYNPVGAAEFIKQQKLSGPCFSDYLTSSYLLWKLAPDFKSYIDLRDLDIFPAPFFSRFAEEVTFPESFAKSDSAYHFNYVVLYRPQFSALHQYLVEESSFRLGFADAVAAVYVRNNNNMDSTPPVFSMSKPVKSSAISFLINKFLNPFYNSFDYNKVDHDLSAAGYYLNIKKFTEAESHALRSAGNNIENYKGEELLGEIYYNKALQEKTAGEREQLLNQAENRYLRSLKLRADFEQAYLGLGAVYFQRRQYEPALENFEKTIALNRSNLSAVNFAAECCKYFINLNNAESKNYLERAIALYQRANKLNPDNPTIQMNLGFLYFRNNDCEKSTKFLNRVSGFSGFSEEQKQNIRTCLRKCSL